MTYRILVCALFGGLFLWSGCHLGSVPSKQTASNVVHQVAPNAEKPTAPMYVPVDLTADLSSLSDQQKKIVQLLIQAAHRMDTLFWDQAYGKRDSLLQTLTDPEVRRYVQINYGPWDRLNNNEPFIEGVGPKPKGANFYPPGMTKEAFNAAAKETPALKSLYTLVRRSETGQLTPVPYHQAYQPTLDQAADLLEQAAKLAENKSFQRYLSLRAQALRTDNYQPSDRAWMEMENNLLEVVIGPIETYEDNLFGYKAAYEAFVLIKDQKWSKRLARYTKLLPMLQKELPVPARYKQETPGREAELNAYDAVYYAGDANAGAKTIAINLPNDEQVQLEKGTRRLQLKNAMRAKFDKILQPIAGELIAPDQRQHLTFDAFFTNTMFHEVAHGLGIKNTITDKGTVRQALQEHYTTIEEGKADILGLYMVKKLQTAGELKVDLMDHYVTFMASIFRSIRFGAASAHGQANLIRFNFFKEQGAFTQNPSTGYYRIHPEKMEAAMNQLTEKILRLQGDGSYEGVNRFIKTYGQMPPALTKSLNRLSETGIPVDIVFNQGPEVLGL